MTKIVPKSLFLLLMVSCFLIGAVPLPAQGYNSPGDTPDISLGGHAWITNKAIEYLKVIAPDAYLLANQYREQLIDGAWYADHNNNDYRCDATGAPSWPCDSINHYEPKFRFTVNILWWLDQGAEGSVSASRYANDLFSVADNCWSSRDPASTLADWYVGGITRGLPEGSLPNSCRVPQWRASHVINLITDFGQFEHDGPPMRIPPLTLLGWALHMVQDSTVVYHTLSTPNNGHAEFENYVDAFIRDPGNADSLPDNTAETSLEVSTPRNCGWREVTCTVSEFVQDVASETYKIAEYNYYVRVWPCCHIIDNQLKPFTKSSLNRAIIYSAKLLSFYLRQHGATELYNAVLTVVVD
jgi:hypothetical protein